LLFRAYYLKKSLNSSFTREFWPYFCLRFD
jgi:hypothetical protein